MRKLVSFSLTIIIVLYFVNYIFYNYDSVYAILHVRWYYVFYISILIAFGLVAKGAINCYVYENLNITLHLYEGYTVAIINAVTNWLPLFGGFFMKGFYLKKKHGLDYQLYFPSTLALYIFSLSINGIIGLITISLIFHFYAIEPQIILTYGYLAFILTGVLLFINFPFQFFPERIQKILNNIDMGWKSLTRNKMVLLKIAITLAINALLVAGRFYICMKIFSQEINILYALLFATAVVITQILNITPSAFGIREAMVGAIGAVVGYDFNLCALAIGIDRFSTVLVTLFLAIMIRKKIFLPTSTEK